MIERALFTRHLVGLNDSDKAMNSSDSTSSAPAKPLNKRPAAESEEQIGKARKIEEKEKEKEKSGSEGAPKRRSTRRKK